MQNINIVNVLKTLNATENASENARLPNTKNLLISISTLVKTLNTTQNAITNTTLILTN